MAKQHVIVIGGGLSGLTAAYRLQTDLPEVEVTVLEANAYPGGRMLTTDFGAEAGGETIGFYYGGVHQLAAEVGVDVGAAPMTMLNASFNLAYYFQASQEWVEQKHWATWEHNPLPPSLRHLPPMMLLREYGLRVPQPDFDELLDHPQMRQLASQSLLEFLRAHGAPDAALPFIQSNFEVNDDLSTLSAFNTVLKTWITQPTVTAPSYYFITGGNQALPQALTARLRCIFYNKKVQSVRVIGVQHEVYTTDGSTYCGDYVILALPAGPMRQIALDPPLAGWQKEAFDNIRYTPSVKIFYRVKKRFWEEDQLPIFMWTDTAVSFVVPVYDKDTRENPITGDNLWGLYVVSNGIWAKKLYNIQHQGGDIAAYCQGILERIRPSMRDALEVETVVDWGNKETALGAFHYYEPSEHIVDYYKHIATSSHGRYFAGEHTEYKHKGFEAAAQAGLRAAREVGQQIVSKRVLILGCGSLGTELARTWRQQYYDVRVTTTTPAKKKALAEVADDVRVLTLNAHPDNVQALAAAVADRDVVVCLVGPVPGRARTPAQIQEHYTENLLRPAQLLTDVLRQRSGPAPHVIFASSLSVYGTGEQTPAEEISEDTPPSPTNPSAQLYAETEQVYLTSGLPVTILRLGALYDRDQHAFVNQARMAIEKMGGMSPFDPQGLLSTLRLWDAARAIDFVVTNCHYGIFNVCEDGQQTVQQFFTQLCAQHGLPPIQHLGIVQGAHKPVTSDTIRRLGFSFTPPHVVVLGAGVLGTQFATLALQQGYRLTLTTVSPADRQALQEQFGPQVEVLLVEGRDTEAVARAMRDKDVVVVAVAPSKERLRGLTFDEHFYGVLSECYKSTAHNVVQAWQAMAHKPQVIYCSADVVYPDTNGAVVDEEAYPLPRHRNAAILREAESTIMDWIPDSVVLRFTWLLNPQRTWRQILPALQRHGLPGTGDTIANMVHVEDAARSILFSIEQKLQGIYNVSNDAHPTWKALWDVVAQQLGIEPPPWHPELEDKWFEAHHTVVSDKMKQAGFTFKYPHETGLSFLGDGHDTASTGHVQSAMMTAWVRAIETQRSDGLFVDPYARHFSMQPHVEFLSVRTKLLDDAILQAVDALQGRCQLVLLGAGMDSRALRLPALASIPVFEMDLPEVMAMKKRLMQQHHVQRPAYVQIAASLDETQWPRRLQAAGHRQAIPTIWVAEGLLTYLTPEHALQLVQQMYHMSASHSVLLVDIAQPTSEGRAPRIRFTCDHARAWLAQSQWAAVEALEPAPQEVSLVQRYQGTSRSIGVFRASKPRQVAIVGCGYFGTRLLHKLRATGQYQIRVTTTTASRTEALLAQGASRVLVWNGTDPQAIRQFLAPVDTAVVSLRSPVHNQQEIVGALRHIAAALRPWQQLLYMSSVDVYAADLHEAMEADACPDKVSTVMEEVFAHHALTCIPRIAQLYGPGTDHRQLCQSMQGHLEKIFTYTKGVLPGDGSQPVHLTHVDDLVAFAELAIARGLHGVYNVCKTLDCTRKAFYEQLCAYYHTVPIRWSPTMQGVKHMTLPPVINTRRLQSLPYALDEQHYAMSALLQE